MENFSSLKNERLMQMLVELNSFEFAWITRRLFEYACNPVE